MFNTIKKIACILAISFSANALAESPKVITIGIIGTDAQQGLKQRWQPMLDDYSKAIGLPVKSYFAPDYAGIIQAMRFKKIQLGYFGNKSAMEAVDRADAELFARYIDEDGEQGYYSVLLANSNNNNINNLQDVIDNRAQLTFGNGEPNSTSGFLVPGFQALAQNDISTRDFKRTINANHGANFMAVAHNTVDVATNHSLNLDRMAESSPALRAKVKVVWQSSLIPSDVLTWRKDFPADLKTKTQAFFVNYGKDGNKQALAALHELKWAGLAATDNNQLLPLRQMETYKSILETQSNTGLSDTDKKQRLMKLQLELDDLSKQMTELEG